MVRPVFRTLLDALRPGELLVRFVPAIGQRIGSGGVPMGANLDCIDWECSGCGESDGTALSNRKWLNQIGPALSYDPLKTILIRGNILKPV